jgi:hypothetical protein
VAPYIIVTALAELFHTAYDFLLYVFWRKAPTIVYWPILMEDFEGDHTHVQRSVAILVRSGRTGSSGFLHDIGQAVWSVNGNLPLASVSHVAGELFLLLGKFRFWTSLANSGRALAPLSAVTNLGRRLLPTLSRMHAWNNVSQNKSSTGSPMNRGPDNKWRFAAGSTLRI